LKQLLKFSGLCASLRERPFVRGVVTLVGGTAFAQGLMVLILPLLTRLYSPEDFELLAIFAAILGLVTVVSCLRLNIAIPLPEDDRTAAALLVLSIGAVALFTVAAIVTVTWFDDTVIEAVGKPRIGPYLWLVPVGVFLASSYTALQYWASRRKKFSLITRTRISRALTGAGTQLGFGMFAAGPLGLILGQILYMGMGTIRLALDTWFEDREYFVRFDPTKLRSTLCAYRRFPLLSVPEALFNSAGIQVSILLIAAYSVGPEAGFTMLAMQVLGAPMALIGGAVAQVYLAEAPEKLRRQELSPFTRKAIGSMMRVGGPILAAIGILSPLLFSPIFGPEWERAGTIVAMLAPSFLLQFLVSPVSMVLHVTGNVLTAMLMQAFGFVLRAGVVLVVAIVAPEWIVEAYAGASVSFYFAYLAIVLALLRRC
jgi:O-antigen/teichoic acid export membrane protein